MVTRSRHVYRDRWISVRADDCVTASGVEVKPFYVLEYPDWVHVVAVDRYDHILLVRQYRHGLGEVSLELPGGMMDRMDVDPVAAGMRELLEETGYGGQEARLVSSLSPNPATHDNRLHLVLATAVDAVQPASPEITENLEIERVPVGATLRLVADGAIINASHVGLLLLGLSSAGHLTF